MNEDNNKISLGGVVIGLALNSVYYYQKEAYGATYEAKIDSQKWRQKERESRKRY